MFVLFPFFFTDVPGSVSLLFITAFHTLELQVVRVALSPTAQAPVATATCFSLSLSLSFDRSISGAIKV